MWGSAATWAAGCFTASAWLAGCAALPFPSGSPYGAPAEIPGGWLDLRGSVHVHTRVSHDSHGSIGEVIDGAHAAGLAFVAFSEHPLRAELRPARGAVEDVLLLPGWEVRSAGASILALGVQSKAGLPDAPDALVAEIHRRGGAAYVAHFESSQLQDPSLYAKAAPDGVEIVNLHATALQVPVRLVLGELLLPAPCALRVLLRTPTENLARLARLSGVRGLVGGVDAHAKFRVLGPLGGTLDRYRDVFRLVTTHVLARERSARGIIEALRAGRSYVAFEGIAPVERFTAVRTGERFTVRAPQDARVELVCSGRTVDSTSGSAVVLRAPADASECHVEAWLGDRLWVITSPLG
ncbi:MAG TPA: hypothetical protein VMR31_05120 [Myxococcota bacterium]|nr:hypothetical protein [Myxococcota bacterium]